jgi:hypothetical protein
MSNDFSVNECRDYEDMNKYTYRKIAENDCLMHLIYDYFTGQVEDISDEQCREAIINALWNL